jgi:uncharacterized membrane protein required for colicin V production
VVAVVASIDSTPGQVFADALLVVAVAVNIYLGWSHGLVRRLVAALGVFVAAFAASNLGNSVAALVHPHSVEANAWSFVAIFIFVVIVVEVLAMLVNDHLQKIVVAAFDRIGGMLVGVAVGVAEVLIVFLVAITVSGDNSPTYASMTQDIHTATLSGQVARLEPQVRTVFGPVLPSNLGVHLAENAVVVTPPI